MNPRLNQVGSKWKELLGAIGAVSAAVVALRTLVEESNKSHQWFKALPDWVQWMVIILLVVVAVRLFFSAMARRSNLLRPGRFLIETETPEHLIGREADLRDLILTCEKHRLVFLPGDSGSGKTALVRAGLVKTCQQRQGKTRLLPLYIDASMLAWEGGLVSELRRALKLLTEGQLKALGTVYPAPDQPLAAWVNNLPSDAERQLLIVIDQFDDYAIRFKDKLIDKAGLVIKRDKLKRKSDDWLMLAKGIEDERLRLLFVCRDDMQWALTPVRFIEPAEKPPLPRLGYQWVKQLFERLTRDDGEGETVSDPSFGWEQLSKRLQQDLAQDGGTVLAIQLVVVVEGLQHLRFLTVGEYQRQGGLTGLEQLYVKAEIEKASCCGGLKLDPVKLLAALDNLLVTADGLKTRSTDQTSLSATMLGVEEPPQKLKPAVDHLVAQRILRRHTTSEGAEQLMLYHDFRARGIREAWLRANGSHELLRHHHASLREALTMGQKWRALLSPRDQVQLAWARLRGRIRYGTYRSLVLKSLVRTLPLALFLVILATVVWQWRLFGQRQQAERCMVFESDALPSEMVQKWTELAGLSEQARLHALEIGLKTQPNNISSHAECIVHAVVGLDPGGRLQQQIAEDILLPALKKSESHVKREHACLVILDELYLHLPAPIAAALVERIKVEKEKSVLLDLTKALSGIGERLEASDVIRLAATLVERMKDEKDSSALFALGGALSDMSVKLDAGDMRPFAIVLVEQMKIEEDSSVLVALGGALSRMSMKLEVGDRLLLADTLVERVKTENESSALSALVSALSGIIKNLELEDVQPFVAALINRMKIEKDSSSLFVLGSALSGMSKKLEARDLQPGAAALTARMKVEQTSPALHDLGRALLSMSDKLDADDVQPGAAALIERMKVENESSKLSYLGKLLSGMSKKLKAGAVSQGEAALVKRMQIELDASELYHLADALSGMSDNLAVKEVRHFADALLERMKVETDSEALTFLESALSGMCDNLGSDDLRPFAAALVNRIRIETDLSALSTLGDALSRMIEKLGANDARLFAKTLSERIMIERNSLLLSKLGSALSSLSKRLEAGDVRPIAEAFLERMKIENDSLAFSTLGMALSSMSEKMAARDVQLFAATLVAQMKLARDSNAIIDLGSVLLRMKGKLGEEDVRPVASILLERMIMEKDSNAIIDLGNVLLGMREKLEEENVRAVASALLERMKNEKESKTISDLALALPDMSEMLEVGVMLSSAGEVLVNRMKIEKDPESYRDLVRAWLPLYRQLQPNLTDRVADIINILQQPIAVEAKGYILDHIESQKEFGEAKFNGKVGKLTEWLEVTERGKALNLNLDFRPH